MEKLPVELQKVLTEIDPRLWGASSAGRGPWEATCIKDKRLNNTWDAGSDTPWAEGPANLIFAWVRLDWDQGMGYMG